MYLLNRGFITFNTSGCEQVQLDYQIDDGQLHVRGWFKWLWANSKVQLNLLEKLSVNPGLLAKSWRANQWPLVRKHHFLSFLPATPSSLSGTLEGLFELPVKGPRLDPCIASGTTETQGHRQVCRARRRGPRPKDTVNNNWNKPWWCVCYKGTFSHRSLIV